MDMEHAVTNKREHKHKHIPSYRYEGVGEHAYNSGSV